MGKGPVTLPLLPHTSGFQGSIPPHHAPPDSLVYGSYNVVYHDFTGMVTQRPGTVTLGAATFSALPVTGITSVTKANGDTRLICADTTKWWKFDSSFAATDITGGVNNTGTATDPWRFAVFSVANENTIFGTNNIDAVRQFVPDAAAYTSPAAFPICRDIMVLANRMVALNVYTGGVRYQAGIKWSATNDPTTWPASALAQLGSYDDPIICGRPLTADTGLIYCAKSIWKIIAQAGGDASAFRFELLESTSGPVNSAALTTVNGIDYYACQDGWIRSCDGSRSQIISAPIAVYVNSFLDTSVTPNTTLVNYAVYHNGTSSVWWTTNNGSAFVYSVRRQQWEPFQDWATNFYSGHYGNATATGASLPMTFLGGTGRLYWLSSNATVDLVATAIPWAIYTPTMCPDPKAQYVVDELDSYISGTGNVTATVYGFDHPMTLAQTGTSLASGTLDLTTGTAQRQVVPVNNLSAADRRRWLQVKYSSTNCPFYWAGGALYVYPEAG